MASSRLSLTVFLIVALVITAVWIAPNILRDDIYASDAAHHVFWAYKYADPELFPDDFASKYFANPDIVPKGYLVLYSLMARVLDAQLASEILGAILFFITLCLTFRLGGLLNTERQDVASWAMAIALLSAILSIGLMPPMGLQRAFALPLTLLAILSIIQRNQLILGFVFLLAALFYPIVCATLGVFTAVVLSTDMVKEKKMPRHWVPLTILGGIALLLILSRNVPESIGPMVTLEHALTMPEFGMGGRQRLFGDGLHGLISHLRTGLGFPKYWIAATLITIVVLQWRGQLSRVPFVVWALAGSAITVWIIARVTMFALYLPQRHTFWALPVFFGMIFAILVPNLLRKASAGIVKTIIGTTMLIIVGFYGYASIEKWREPVNRDLEAAFEYLRGLPPDTLVAAHPIDANEVPMRSRRSVLVSQETSISFMLGYYHEASQRISAAIDATYASQWTTVDALAARWGVDVFLVTGLPWTLKGYYEPFDAQARRVIEDGAANGYVLKDPPRNRVLFSSGDVALIRVGAVTNGL